MQVRINQDKAAEAVKGIREKARRMDAIIRSKPTQEEHIKQKQHLLEAFAEDLEQRCNALDEILRTNTK